MKLYKLSLLVLLTITLNSCFHNKHQVVKPILEPLIPSQDYHSYANTDEVIITHISLDLQVSFDEKILKGRNRIFYSKLNPEAKTIVLDAKDLTIKKVLTIDDEGKESKLKEIVTVKATGETFKAGDIISLNGSTGECIRGAMDVKVPTLGGDLGVVLKWCDEQKNVMKVYANADSGKDSAQAAKHGAQGIGLCRTEHMFFDPERLPVVQHWILRGGKDYLAKVEGFQRADFNEIFEAMNAKKVTIRLLDPPLHEFVPHVDQVNEEIAARLGYDNKHKLQQDIEDLHEENPMLGLRGCRLGIVHEDLTQMQVRAIMHAAADHLERGGHPHPRIMVPLVGNLKEFENQALVIKREAEYVRSVRNMEIPYEIGTMIEVPRAAIISGQIAGLVDKTDGKRLCNFFSYGTNVSIWCFNMYCIYFILCVKLPV